MIGAHYNAPPGEKILKRSRLDRRPILNRVELAALFGQHEVYF